MYNMTLNTAPRFTAKDIQIKSLLGFILPQDQQMIGKEKTRFKQTLYILLQPFILDVGFMEKMLLILIKVIVQLVTQLN